MGAPDDSGQRRWDRAAELYSAALELPGPQRSAFLATAAGSDAALLAELRELLARPVLGGPLDKPPGDLLAGSGDWRPWRPRLVDGLTLAERFVVKRFLGRGGMGEVYEALDSELGEPVAIKLLNSELGPDPRFVERFRREIRLARRVAHVNVCKVFDLMKDDRESEPLHFFVMEFVPGETLAARLARTGALPHREALDVARQIAAGLTAAHEAGVIHRDLKPGNIMLSAGRAVITDFGLATSILPPAEDAGASTHTSGLLLGTPGYVAPEQLSGQPATAAADIYNYGVILHEMISGRHPLATTAPPGSTQPPRAWRTVISRCLTADPTTRWASATEAAGQLESRAISPRRAILAGGGALAFSAAAVSLFPWLRRLNGWKRASRPGATLLLTPITYPAAEPHLAGLTVAMQSLLAQSREVNLVDAAALGSTLRQMGKTLDDIGRPESAREVAWRLQSPFVFFGTVARVGSDYSLEVQLEQTGSTPRQPAQKTRQSFPARDAGALMPALRDASLWVRERLGESGADVAKSDRLAEEITTPSWEALAYYSQAMELNAVGRRADALLLFDSALSKDPDFTLASVRKGDLLMQLNREADGLAQWKHAIASLDRRPVSRREELRARAMFLFDSGEVTKSEAAFRTWAVEYPNDPLGHFYRTVPLVMDGYVEEALENLRRLTAKQPDASHLWAWITSCCALLGRDEEGRAAVAKLMDVGERHRAHIAEGCLAFSARKYDEARLALDRAAAADPSRHLEIALYRALAFADQGRHADALEVLEQAAARPAESSRAPQLASVHLAAASTALRLNRPADAGRHAARSLEFDRSPGIAAEAGTILTRTGHLRLASRLLAEMEARGEFRKYSEAAGKITAAIQWERGLRNQAVRRLEAIATAEPRWAWREYLMPGLLAAGRRAEAAELVAAMSRHRAFGWIFVLSFPFAAVRAAEELTT